MFSSSLSSRAMKEAVDAERNIYVTGGTLLGEFAHPAPLVRAPAAPIAQQKQEQEQEQDEVEMEAEAETGKDQATRNLPRTFESSPLLPEFVQSLTETLGQDAKPTAIQALSLKWLLENPNADMANAAAAVQGQEGEEKWKQFLLAAETGSGKSFAYLLPLLQSLKLSEARARSAEAAEAATSTSTAPAAKKWKPKYAPRAIILAPTHELARQLSGFAKSLVHEAKLRVVCVSKANVKNRDRSAAPEVLDVASEARLLGKSVNGARDAADVVEAGEVHEPVDDTPDVVEAGGVHGPVDDAPSVTEAGGTTRELGLSFPVDVIVGTPVRLMEMCRGMRWEWERVSEVKKRLRDEKKLGESPSDADMKTYKSQHKKGIKELALDKVEWVIVDEADVLFDPDFQVTTRSLLADISEARGHPVPLTTITSSILSDPKAPTPRGTPPSTPSSLSAPPEPISYPFNLVLTSATIPTSLSTYLSAHHPRLIRLASPHLHRLPKKLVTEYFSWTKHAAMPDQCRDVERQIREVWLAETRNFATAAATTNTTNTTNATNATTTTTTTGEGAKLSKILVFVNKSSKVEVLGEYLEKRGIQNVALEGKSDARLEGSNHHLDGFLRERRSSRRPLRRASQYPDPIEYGVDVDKDGTTADPSGLGDPKVTPHVLITTSLLSRGLDFSPEVRNVFIMGEPRNLIDFLHRAGRTARAGYDGRVVIFGKTRGKGGGSADKIWKRVASVLGGKKNRHRNAEKIKEM